MASKGEYLYMIMTPVIFALCFLLGAVWCRVVIDPKVFYDKNVCKFLGGQTHDDVCIVDGKVIDIKNAKVVLK
jgi:hypothetical protein